MKIFTFLHLKIKLFSSKSKRKKNRAPYREKILRSSPDFQSRVSCGPMEIIFSAGENLKTIWTHSHVLMIIESFPEKSWTVLHLGKILAISSRGRFSSSPSHQPDVKSFSSHSRGKSRGLLVKLTRGFCFHFMTSATTFDCRKGKKCLCGANT